MVIIKKLINSFIEAFKINRTNKVNDSDKKAIDERIIIESNRIFQRIFGIVLISNIISFFLVLLAEIISKEFTLSTYLYILIGTSIIGLLYYSAYKRYIKGYMKYLIILPLTAFPLFLSLFEYQFGNGAASIIASPFMWGTFISLFFTIFLFDFKLSIISGAVASSCYFFIYYLSLPDLLTLEGSNQALILDLVGILPTVIKGLIFFLAGLLAGVFSIFMRKLIIDVLYESKEKESLNKLFSQFVNDQVREKIVLHKKKHLSEKKNVAILFCDIRNFTSFSEKTDSEEVIRKLNSYYEEMVNVVTNNDGIVDKFIGDAFLAVFGGVIPLENPSLQAHLTILEIQSALQKLNMQWKDEGKEIFQIGIGLHYGEVVEGTLGSKDWKQYTVIGDVVNTASRIEGLTKTFKTQVLISDTIYKALPIDIQNTYKIEDTIVLKGRSHETTIYSLNK